MRSRFQSHLMVPRMQQYVPRSIRFWSRAGRYRIHTQSHQLHRRSFLRTCKDAHHLPCRIRPLRSMPESRCMCHFQSRRFRHTRCCQCHSCQHYPSPVGRKSAPNMKMQHRWSLPPLCRHLRSLPTNKCNHALQVPGSTWGLAAQQKHKYRLRCQ